MGSSLPMPSETERHELAEADYVKQLAKSCQCYRMYKLGGKVEGGWSHYKPIHYPEEEGQIPGSGWDYAVLVYDEGKVVNIDGLWEKSPLRKNRGGLHKLL